MYGLLILCHRREVDALVDVLEDWKDHARIVLYGSTNKAQDGFILMHWTQPIPKSFQLHQLHEDRDILDYLIYDLTPPQPPSTTTL